MNDKKLSPSKKLVIRQNNDKRQYERLAKQAERHLEHHSPGVYGATEDAIKFVDTAFAHSDYAIYHVAAGLNATISKIIDYVE